MKLKLKNGWNVSLKEDGSTIEFRALKDNCEKVFSNELTHDEVADKLSEVNDLGEYDYIKLKVVFFEGDDYYGWRKVGHRYYDQEPTEEEVYQTMRDEIDDAYKAIVYDINLKYLKTID
jgi:hypothetical protein